MAKRILGTFRSDKWTGTSSGDRFLGRSGNDKCNGAGGNDIIDGGTGGDDISGGAGNDDLYGGAGNDSIDGGAGDDYISAGAGDDSIDGGSGRDTIFAGAGNDNLDGGSGNDRLNAGAGNDFIVGGTGTDRIWAGYGDDTVVWNNLDGSDVISGNDGQDTVVVNGSFNQGDNFVLSARETIAFFERTGLNGQPIGRINLTVDTSEVFDVKGLGGNDTFTVNTLTGTDVTEIRFFGDAGNDILDARNTSTHITANGGAGNDTLTGGTGTITVTQPNNTTTTLGDTLTGGEGQDKFQFLSDPFAGGVAGQNVNRPDVITDYEIGVDQIVLGKTASGINTFNFQKGNSGQLTGNSNLVVLTDQTGFQNAGAAARAIADSPNFNGGKGVFVYFNTTLGFSRVVLSEDLGNNGRFSVLGNLAGQTSIVNHANFTQADFSLA